MRDLKERVEFHAVTGLMQTVAQLNVFNFRTAIRRRKTSRGIEVVDEWMHETADGRRLWITHGDLFDGVIQCAKWLAYVGDSLYTFILKLNKHFNSARARMGLPYWSLSKYLKQKVKRAVSYIGDFEVAVAREAKRRGADGVVCGHIHHAEMRDIDGVLSCNDGDWVESLTALVEHPDGRLEILDWSRQDLHGRPAQREQEPVPQPGVRQPELAVLSEVMSGR